MNGLTTDSGSNYQAVIYMAMGSIVAMEDGSWKSILIAICLICLALVSWMTKGSGLTKEEGKKLLDTAEDITDVLRRGRDDHK